MKKNISCISFIYAGSFLFAVCVVIGCLVWSQYESVTQKQLKKQRTANCIMTANENYDQNWAAACVSDAKMVQQEFNNCVNGSKRQARFLVAGSGGYVSYNNLYKNYVAQCKSAYGNPNSSPTCMLPISNAKSLNEGLEKAEKLCVIVS